MKVSFCQELNCVLHCLEMENCKLILLILEYTLNAGFDCGELCCAEDGN